MSLKQIIRLKLFSFISKKYVGLTDVFIEGIVHRQIDNGLKVLEVSFIASFTLFGVVSNHPGSAIFVLKDFSSPILDCVDLYNNSKR